MPRPSFVGRTSFPRPPTPYERYMADEGVPIHRGLVGVADARELPRGPWRRLNARGAFVELEGLGNIQGLWLLEVAPGSETVPERHLFEEVYIVLAGRGQTEVWSDDGASDVVEWGPWSVFTVPLNAWHRLAAAAGEPAIILVGSNAPIALGLYGSREFIFGCEYPFSDRFQPNGEFYRVTQLREHPMNGRALNSDTFIRDVTTVEVPIDGQRGEGHRHFELEMDGNVYQGFVAEYSPGRYSMAHAHESGAILTCVQGAGYTLSWPKSAGVRPWESGHGDLVRKTVYRAGGFVSAAPGGAEWFHAHFPVSAKPFRVVTMSGGYTRRVTGQPGDIVSENQDMKLGGDSIAYEDEDPMIRSLFREELAKQHVEFAMPASVYEAETSAPVSGESLAERE